MADTTIATWTFAGRARGSLFVTGVYQQDAKQNGQETHSGYAGGWEFGSTPPGKPLLLTIANLALLAGLRHTKYSCPRKIICNCMAGLPVTPNSSMDIADEARAVKSGRRDSASAAGGEDHRHRDGRRIGISPGGWQRWRCRGFWDGHSWQPRREEPTPAAAFDEYQREFYAEQRARDAGPLAGQRPSAPALARSGAECSKTSRVFRLKRWPDA